MPAPRMIEGYGKVKDLLDKALELGQVVIACPTENAAIKLRHTIYSCRKRDRELNMRTLQKDSSHWDSIVVLKGTGEEAHILTITKDIIDSDKFKLYGPDGTELEL